MSNIKYCEKCGNELGVPYREKFCDKYCHDAFWADCRREQVIPFEILKRE